MLHQTSECMCLHCIHLKALQHDTDCKQMRFTYKIGVTDRKITDPLLLLSQVNQHLLRYNSVNTV